ncbi:MAG: GGDEF domain-containing protein [Thermosyntropha sp.]|nr:GGDEF domain-containing protein [Thermosyntropha sp.]
MLNGGEERVLVEAFEDLIDPNDSYFSEAVNILDVHINALKDVLGVEKDNDQVQWLYIERANEFLAQIFMSVDNIMFNLREQLERDVLTGLYNRLALSRVLSLLWLDALKKGKNFTVGMLDLDNFKNINDVYGHGIGDEVLKTVADVLRRDVRGNDMVFRFGGEEFILLFNNSDYEQAIIPAGRIREKIENLIVSDFNIKVTVSIGLSSYSEDKPESADELIRFADLAMYEAKRKGKNRIEMYRNIK